MVVRPLYPAGAKRPERPPQRTAVPSPSARPVRRIRPGSRPTSGAGRGRASVEGSSSRLLPRRGPRPYGRRARFDRTRPHLGGDHRLQQPPRRVSARSRRSQFRAYSLWIDQAVTRQPAVDEQGRHLRQVRTQPQVVVGVRAALGAAPSNRLGQDAPHRLRQLRFIAPGRPPVPDTEGQSGLHHGPVQERRLQTHPEGRGELGVGVGGAPDAAQRE